MLAQSGNVPFYQSYNVPWERDIEMDLLTMSAKEMNRLEVMQRLDEKRMKQKAAAELLGISRRILKYKMDKLGIQQDNSRSTVEQ